MTRRGDSQDLNKIRPEKVATEINRNFHLTGCRKPEPRKPANMKKTKIKGFVDHPFLRGKGMLIELTFPNHLSGREAVEVMIRFGMDREITHLFLLEEDGAYTKYVGSDFSLAGESKDRPRLMLAGEGQIADLANDPHY